MEKPTRSLSHFKLKCTLVEEITDSAANCFLEPYKEWPCTDWPPSRLDLLGPNKMKHLKVAYLFHIKQNKGETLKSYLARFNNATVRVNDPDKKNFMKAFQKG
ncbi:hypothetical protein CR513_33442, partial [Mucuna pruriens]